MEAKVHEGCDGPFLCVSKQLKRYKELREAECLLGSEQCVVPWVNVREQKRDPAAQRRGMLSCVVCLRLWRSTALANEMSQDSGTDTT